MTSSDLLPTSLLEETHISPTVTVEDAQRFFEQHGIFYAPDAEVGRLVATLGSEAVHRKRLQTIIGPFADSFCFTLGPDPTKFYASTISKNPDHRVIVYMWGKGGHCEFSEGSHLGELKGVPASNGLVQVPYAWLKKRELPDRTVKFENGGM
ncbi:hypothetical protein N7448_011317 [Penicillium atrosanguineum]|nr:hypothetical protein N7448_011317 [Penicillium atrosanguineum]